MQTLSSLRDRDAPMRRGICYVLLAALATLTACAESQVHPVSASYPNRQWLVGGWVPDGEDCASDAGVIYRPDGTWTAEDMAGTWRLRGADLLLTIRSSETGQLAEAGGLRERIEMRGPDELLARRGDGSTRILKRCPSRRPTANP